MANASSRLAPDGGTWYDHSDANISGIQSTSLHGEPSMKRRSMDCSQRRKKFVPEWTIEEIYEELWQYGESLEWPMYEVVST